MSGHPWLLSFCGSAEWKCASGKGSFIPHRKCNTIALNLGFNLNSSYCIVQLDHTCFRLQKQIHNYSLLLSFWREEKETHWLLLFLQAQEHTVMLIYNKERGRKTSLSVFNQPIGEAHCMLSIYSLISLCKRSVFKIRGNKLLLDDLISTQQNTEMYGL